MLAHSSSLCVPYRARIRSSRYSSSLLFGQNMRGTGFEPPEHRSLRSFRASNPRSALTALMSYSSREVRGTGFEPEEDSFHSSSRVRNPLTILLLACCSQQECAGPDSNRLNVAHSVRSFRASNPHSAFTTLTRCSSREVRGTGFEPADPYGIAS